MLHPSPLVGSVDLANNDSSTWPQSLVSRREPHTIEELVVVCLHWIRFVAVSEPDGVARLMAGKTASKNCATESDIVLVTLYCADRIVAPGHGIGATYSPLLIDYVRLGTSSIDRIDMICDSQVSWSELGVHLVGDVAVAGCTE